VNWGGAASQTKEGGEEEGIWPEWDQSGHPAHGPPFLGGEGEAVGRGNILGDSGQELRPLSLEKGRSHGPRRGEGQEVEEEALEEVKSGGASPPIEEGGGEEGNSLGRDQPGHPVQAGVDWEAGCGSPTTEAPVENEEGHSPSSDWW